MKNFKIYQLCWLLLPVLFHAQVLNIEKERLDQDTLSELKIKLSADLKLYNRSVGDNDQTKGLNFSLDISTIYEPGKHAYIFIAELDYERANSLGLLDFGYVHGRVNWMKEKKLSYETFVQISYDNSRGLDMRTLLGGDLRYRLLKNKHIEVYASTGIMYEKEDWQHPYNDDVLTSNILKSTNYLKIQYKINDMLDLNNVLYYQVGLDDKVGRNRIQNWLILNTKLSKTLSLKNSFVIAYEDKPIVPITKFIYTLKTGIAVNL